MAIYLVDYENNKNLLGISGLAGDDLVIIFYSEKASTLSFDSHREILSSKAAIEYRCVEVGGQNALDFQLSTYLGYLIKQNEGANCKYYIVSKDKGYSFVASFWKKQKSVDVQLVSDLTGKNAQPAPVESAKPAAKKVQAPPPKKTETNPALEESLRQSHPELTDEEIASIMAIVAKYKTAATINGNLNKLFKDSTRTGEILKLIKPFLKK